MGSIYTLSVHLGVVSCVVSCCAVPCRRGCVLLRGEVRAGRVGLCFSGLSPSGIARWRRRLCLARDRVGCWGPRRAVPCWPHSYPSCLLHDGLGATNLPLNLLPGPASSFDGARLELPVRPRFLNHCRDPLLPETINQLAVGICVCEVTVGS